MIEVRYVPGAVTAVWGPRIAVLIDLGTDDSLPGQLAALVATPEAGTRDVLRLLVSQHRQVSDFSMAEELADGRVQLVLRGRAACHIDGTTLHGGGMWRGRVIAPVGALELRDLRSAADDQPRRERDQDDSAPVLASALVIRRAGAAAVDSRPRRAMPFGNASDGAETG